MPPPRRRYSSNGDVNRARDLGACRGRSFLFFLTVKNSIHATTVESVYPEKQLEDRYSTAVLLYPLRTQRALKIEPSE